MVFWGPNYVGLKNYLYHLYLQCRYNMLWLYHKAIAEALPHGYPGLAPASCEPLTKTTNVATSFKGFLLPKQCLGYIPLKTMLGCLKPGRHRLQFWLPVVLDGCASTCVNLPSQLAWNAVPNPDSLAKSFFGALLVTYRSVSMT